MSSSELGESKKKYEYWSIRDGHKVRRMYVGRRSEPAVELASRARRLSAAIKKSQAQSLRDLRSSAQATKKLLTLPTTVASKWRLLEGSRFGGDRAQNDPRAHTLDSQAELISQAQYLLRTIMTPARFNRLEVAAQSGDPIAQRELGEQLKKHRELIATSLDLVEIAKATVIEGLVGSSPSTAVVIETKIQQDLNELEIDKCQSSIERLLCELTAVTFINAFKNQMLCLQGINHQGTEAFRQSMAASANKQFTTAAKALVDLRRKQNCKS